MLVPLKGGFSSCIVSHLALGLRTSRAEPVTLLPLDARGFSMARVGHTHRQHLDGNYSGEYGPHWGMPDWDSACQGEDWARNIALPTIDLAR